MKTSQYVNSELVTRDFTKLSCTLLRKYTDSGHSHLNGEFFLILHQRMKKLLKLEPKNEKDLIY